MPSNTKPFTCLKYLTAVALALVVFLTIAWFARVPLLNGFTNLWVIDEGRVPADAVVVLGGGANTRTFAAAQAYNDGLVKTVLIPDVKLEPIEIMGLKQSHTEICKSVVLDEGVPDLDIQLFGDQVSSTWEEVNALKLWCDNSQAKVILAPTEFPFTRRLRWVLDQVFEDSETIVHVFPIDNFNYTRDAWWESEYGIIDMQNDFVKYVLYRLKY